MKNLYVDMDGTLARFHDEVDYLERMYEKDFFLDLLPFHSVVDAIRILAQENAFNVYILSSCITENCKEEKKMWLGAFMSEIPESNYIFTEMGQNKAMCIGHPISKDDVLLDDYNLNLGEWQDAGGTSIKLVNNINDKGLRGPRWKGFRVCEVYSPQEIALSIKTIAEII